MLSEVVYFMRDGVMQGNEVTNCIVNGFFYQAPTEEQPAIGICINMIRCIEQKRNERFILMMCGGGKIKILLLHLKITYITIEFVFVAIVL